MGNIDTKGIIFTIKLFVLVVSLYVSASFIGNSISNIISISEINPNFFRAQIYQASLNNLLKDNQNEIHLGFVGDIMLSRDVEKTIEQEAGGDFRFPFLKIADALRKYDVLFGNLEGPLSHLGENQGSLYSFCMNPMAMNGLIFAGFDVLSVANNHIGDWGPLAMQDTFERLENNGIVVVGGGMNENEAYSEKIIEKKGTKIAYLGFSQFGEGYLEADKETPGIAVIHKQRLEESIKKAHKNADIVIVSFHFGNEYQNEQNEYQTTIAHFAVDAGADIIVGHHPHVVQPSEKYKNSYIIYSLGNFVFDQSFSADTMEGRVLDVVIENKSISKIVEHAVRLNEFFQPELID